MQSPISTYLISVAKVNRLLMLHALCLIYFRKYSVYNCIFQIELLVDGSSVHVYVHSLTEAVGYQVHPYIVFQTPELDPYLHICP